MIRIEHDKDISAYQAVDIAKKDAAINQAIKDMAVSVGIMMLNGGMPTEDQNNKLIAISKPDSDIGKLKQSLAITPESVELVEVERVRIIDECPTLCGSKTDAGFPVYTIKMKAHNET